MMGLHNAGKRIEDLSSWPTERLKRRLKLEADMWRALSGLGYEGTHRRLLSLDTTIISRILRRRGIN